MSLFNGRRQKVGTSIREKGDSLCRQNTSCAAATTKAVLVTPEEVLLSSSRERERENESSRAASLAFLFRRLYLFIIDFGIPFSCCCTVLKICNNTLFGTHCVVRVFFLEQGYACSGRSQRCKEEGGSEFLLRE